VSGIVLAALEQQVISVVTVNGRSAAVFAKAHAGTPVFGPLTAQRQSKLERLLQGSLDGNGDIRPLDEMNRLSLDDGSDNDIVAYVIEDPQMRNWPEARRGVDLPELRDCRVAIGQLEPDHAGNGRWVLAGLRKAISFLPARCAAVGLNVTDP